MYETIGDIVKLVDRMAQSGSEELRKHAATLVGARTRGSTTQIGLSDIRLDQTIELFVSDAVSQDCVCFSAAVTGLGGIVKATTLKDALEYGYDVELRNGDHGYELFIDQEDGEGFGIGTNIAYFIIGESEGQDALFTWHPGEPLEPLSGQWGPFRDTTAVKLHNG